MATYWGKTPLQKLKAFRARKWFPTEFVNLVERIASNYASRNEVLSGFADLAIGTMSTTSIGVTIDAGQVMLNGRIYEMASLSDTTIFQAATGVIGQAIFKDGETAVVLPGFAGMDGESIYLSVIACNSDGAGGVDEDDDGDAVYVAVVAGTTDSSGDIETLDSDHLNAREISDALEASTVHNAGSSGSPEEQQVSWVYMYDLVLLNSSDTITNTSIVLNRNNAVQGH